MEINSEQSKFEGWAIVDALGHQRHAGYVTTEHFGQTVLFRVATPPREQRDRELSDDAFIDGYSYCPKGCRVAESEMPPSERYVGAGSIYMLTPTPREKVMDLLDEISPRRVLGVSAADGTPIEKPKQSDDMPW